MHLSALSSLFTEGNNTLCYPKGRGGGGGALATASDLAAFRLFMIGPVKKCVNHSRTVASMCETGSEQEHSLAKNAYACPAIKITWSISGKVIGLQAKSPRNIVKMKEEMAAFFRQW